MGAWLGAVLLPTVICRLKNVETNFFLKRQKVVSKTAIISGRIVSHRFLFKGICYVHDDGPRLHAPQRGGYGLSLFTPIVG